MAAPTSKSRIESLSDLIFGLALSISALSLIARPITDLSQITQNILGFLFGFLILISVWLRYTRTMEYLRIETPLTMLLNVALLFFVSLEPYLFNLLLTSPSPVVGVSNTDWWLYISSLYAVDLGSLFLILGVYSVVALRSKSPPPSPEAVQHLTAARNAQFIGAAFIFVSLVPFFGSWNVLQGTVLEGVTVRVLLWWAPLVLLRVQRHLVPRARHVPRLGASTGPGRASDASEPERLADEH